MRDIDFLQYVFILCKHIKYSVTNLLQIQRKEIDRYTREQMSINIILYYKVLNILSKKNIYLLFES
jgi:hypothetical protein